MLDKYPKILEHQPTLKNKLKKTKIFDGIIVVSNKDFELRIQGNIFLDYSKSLTIRFAGTLLNETTRELLFLFPSKSLNIIFDQSHSKCFLTSFRSHREKSWITGTIQNGLVVGNKREPIDSLFFEIPNLKSFRGEIYRSKNALRSGRVIFCSGEFEILLDQVKEKNFDLPSFERYGLNSNTIGLIRKHDNSIFYTFQVNALIENFYWFLSFYTGSRTGPVGMTGKLASINTYIQYDEFEIDEYRNIMAWHPQNDPIDVVVELWNNYIKMAENKDTKEILSTAIYWYCLANRIEAGLEASIIIIQSALEMLSNYFVISEQSDEITSKGRTYRSLNSLLKQYQLDCSLSEELTELQKFAKGFTPVLDGLSTFIEIRNCLVHTTTNKLNKISKLNPKAYSEAWQLGMFYLESCMLKILNYKGRYYCRISSRRKILTMNKVKC